MNLVAGDPSLPFYHLIKKPSVGEGPYSALFLLHGYGSNEEDLASLAGFFPKDVFVISVQGPFPSGFDGFAWYALNFDASGAKTADIGQAIHSRDAVASFIEEAIKSYRLDPDKISVLGFSQGAILGYAIALSYPRLIKNLLAISGYLDKKLLNLNPTSQSHDYSKLRVYASHGVHDPVIPFLLSKESMTVLESLGVHHDFQPFDSGHSISEENLNSLLTWFKNAYS